MPRRLVQNLSPRIGGALLTGTLLLFASQLRCADANNFIEDDDPALTGDGGVQKGDLAEGPCFMGTPQTEPNLLNRCSDAERIERGSKIPASLWDGQSPLPYEK
ncbi:MAG TPA: hypothetical protein PLY80_07070 [Pseudomonadota bacterium]|nr:hypothetical protein [Pseudomonadota bacterium]